MEYTATCVHTFIHSRNQLCPSLAPFVTAYSPFEYARLGATLYLSADRLSGFGITAEGEIISVFSLVRGRGDALVRAAVERGGRYLDCLGEHLRTLYERGGLIVTNTIPWNDTYAPVEWDFERFGRPSVYEMVLRS